MNNIITMTLPAKPQPQKNIGLMFAPLLMEIVGNKILSQKMITLNTLHTYIKSSNYIEMYTNNLKELDFKFDEYYEDTNHKEELLNILRKLIYSGKVFEKTKKIYKCNCGKVEFLEDGKCFNDGKLYTKHGDDFICNECNSKAIIKEAKVLVMNYNIMGEKVNVFPSFLSKEMMYFSNLFSGKDILISKLRDTGLSVILNNNKYNIDVEYVWSQLHGISIDNKVMIASNHQVYIMFIINYLNRLNNGKDILFILTPYMDNSSKFANFDEKIYKLSIIKIKLFMFYSLKWKKKTCSWDYGLYKKIKNLDEQIAKKLFDNVCCQLKYANFNQMVNKIEKDFMQRNLDKDLEKIKSETSHFVI